MVLEFCYAYLFRDHFHFLRLGTIIQVASQLIENLPVEKHVY